MEFPTKATKNMPCHLLCSVCVYMCVCVCRCTFWNWRRFRLRRGKGWLRLASLSIRIHPLWPPTAGRRRADSCALPISSVHALLQPRFPWQPHELTIALYQTTVVQAVFKLWQVMCNSAESTAGFVQRHITSEAEWIWQATIVLCCRFRVLLVTLKRFSQLYSDKHTGQACLSLAVWKHVRGHGSGLPG